LRRVCSVPPPPWRAAVRSLRRPREPAEPAEPASAPALAPQGAPPPPPLSPPPSALCRLLARAPAARPALCQRGAPALLAGLLQRRLAPAPSLQVLARLPLAAAADALRLLGALAGAGAGAEEGRDVLRAPGLLEALERALALQVETPGALGAPGTAGAATPSSSPRLAALAADLLAVRAAAARALAQLAAVQGRDEWAARPALLLALVAALADDEPGVRAPVAAALLALAMQPAARVRAALRDAGAVQALRRAAASRRGDAGLAGTLAATLARLAPQ